MESGGDSKPGFDERAVCPVCGGGSSSTLLRRRFEEEPLQSYLTRKYGDAWDAAVLASGEYRLDQCAACALVFQRLVPNDSLLRVVYDEWENQDDLHSKKQRRSLRNRSRRAIEVMALIDFAGRDPGELRVLDYGMGWGDWCRLANAFGCETYGVENAPARVAFARSLGLSVLDDRDLDAYDFDFINTEQVFEHLIDPSGTAVRLASRLRPGGVLRISVPNGVHVAERLRKLDRLDRSQQFAVLDRVSPFQHVNCFTGRTLHELAAGLGLRPVKLPLRLRYRYAPIWEPVATLAKITLGLHYRALRGQSTVVWLQR